MGIHKRTDLFEDFDVFTVKMVILDSLILLFIYFLVKYL